MNIASARNGAALVLFLFAHGALAQTPLMLTTDQFTGFSTNAFARTNGKTVRMEKTKTVKIDPDSNVIFAPKPEDAFDPPTLLLFLPGHGSDAKSYRQFMSTAVKQGYYVIGLAYRNGQSLQNLCGYWPDCHGAVIEENVSGAADPIFYRGDHQGDRHFPTSDNTINFRLGKLLEELDRRRFAAPFDWKQFYDFDRSDVRWSKIVIAGHSEGAATAAWIVKNRSVIAGLTFEGPYSDWDNAFEGDAGAHLGAPSGNAEYSPCTFAQGSCRFADHAPAQEVARPASYLTPGDWTRKLFLTLQVDDPGYEQEAIACDAGMSAECKNTACRAGKCFKDKWPGLNMRMVGNALGKTEHLIDKCPESLDGRSWFTSTTPAGKKGHEATVVDGNVPPWMPCYWRLLLRAALPPAKPPPPTPVPSCASCRASEATCKGIAKADDKQCAAQLETCEAACLK